MVAQFSVKRQQFVLNKFILKPFIEIPKPGGYQIREVLRV